MYTYSYLLCMCGLQWQCSGFVPVGQITYVVCLFCVYIYYWESLDLAILGQGFGSLADVERVQLLLQQIQTHVTWKSKSPSVFQYVVLSLMYMNCFANYAELRVEWNPSIPNTINWDSFKWPDLGSALFSGVSLQRDSTILHTSIID